ncbi:MAG: hypothetical protein HY327_01135 [Chloroflexi bacterium]|nr:hypothetical protein [Chloroflexota bacterium]
MSKFNSRKYQTQLERELIGGGILITLVIGGGLIGLIWGSGALIAALGCFVLAAGLIALIWLFLKALEWLSREK